MTDRAAAIERAARAAETALRVDAARLESEESFYDAAQLENVADTLKQALEIHEEPNVVWVIRQGRRVRIEFMTEEGILHVAVYPDMPEGCRSPFQASMCLPIEREGR